MLLYALRRLIYLVPVAFGVSLLVFALVHLAPGDPISAIVPPDAPKEVVDKLKEYYGFDKPLPVQYFRWLAVTLTGDFGTSIGTGRPVASEVASAFGNTIILAIAATTLAFTLAVILGTAAAYAKSRIVDRLVTLISLVGVSVPHFWLAIVLVIIFAVELGALPPMGIVARTVRALVGDLLSQEFVTALRAKGLTEVRVFVHVAKNAAPTAIAVMGLQFGYLLGGSILIETVFAWPGTGFLLNSAIFRRDLPILQGTTLVLAFFFMLLNLTVDIIQTMVDPRIKRN